jgi:molecular chaperone HtpG
MTAAPETFEFRSEARQLLDLMIHALYSHKEIFLRELISNASDALDKLRFEALTNRDLLPAGHEPGIRLEADAQARTLTISDNGIGMDRDELIRNLGTIAHSGTKEFAAKVRQAREQAEGAGQDRMAELIGQFGVGFYSSFMAAESVEVVSRRAGTAEAWRWLSTGDGKFTLEPAERDEPGTSITLKLRPADPDNELADFTDGWTLERVVKKYSDFVTYPIRLREERDDKVEWRQLNSMKALWMRPQSEVKPEEYAELYKHLTHDWEPPFETLAFRAEGTFEYRALLFLPSRPPFDLFWREQKWGLQLYVNKVRIMDQCEELLPSFLRFVKGIVESPDLSLNVSREILQQDSRVRQIRKRIVKKVIESLEKIQRDEPERYAKFWESFGRVLKEGVAGGDPEASEKLPELFWFASSHDREKLTTLKDYVGRMKDGQDAIYYATGESRATVEKSPHLEAFLARGYEVLYLTDPVDELLTNHLTEFEGKKLQSVGKGTVDLGTEEEKKQAEEARAEQQKAHASLLELIQKNLDEFVKEVRLSTRLTTSAVCLVGEEGDMSPRLERLLREVQAQAPKAKRILELNPNHPVLGKMQAIFDANPADPRLPDYTRLLYGQALLAEGSALPDPVDFARLVADLMVKA